MHDVPSRLAVFDLDGTVLVGDEPVLTYLRELVARTALPAAAESTLRAYLRDGGDDPDAYAFVARLAAEAGVGPSVRGAAYAASRDALHEGRIDVEVAEGLPALLDERPPGVVAVLVTNAPVAGVAPLLDRLGLGGRFDRLIGDAGKPAGMSAVLRGLLAEYGVPPERLLAVGDIWANDLAAADDLGGTTALIDRHGRGGGAPDFRAGTLSALIPAIERWWGPLR